MSDLTFENVSKRYVVRKETEADLTMHPWLRKVKALRTRKEPFWALRDVSFEVKRGETLGIIGHNGAGKSTILKLLSGITTPTSGSIRIEGRLSALIEVGSGFHPELTGRENIFLNGAILGMTKREIAAKLDSIVDFAGVRPFLDVPVKRFSSGMYVRLGFSIAAHLDPDILLLDEVLAVGDAAFQERCLTRINELRRSGTTIVFISHDLGAVERICSRALLMDKGQIVASGTAAEAISEYQRRPGEVELNTDRTSHADGSAQVSSVSLSRVEPATATTLHTGAALCIRVSISVQRPLPDAAVEIVFRNPDRHLVAEWSTAVSPEMLSLTAGEAAVEFRCPVLGLMPGIYYISACIKRRAEPEAIHWQHGALVIRVDPGQIIRGDLYMPYEWRTVAPSQPVAQEVCA